MPLVLVVKGGAGQVEKNSAKSSLGESSLHKVLIGFKSDCSGFVFIGSMRLHRDTNEWTELAPITLSFASALTFPFFLR
jgi:hypothetical protein